MTSASTNHIENLDPAERAKFDESAAAWWDPEGPMRPLHDLNPARLRYVRERSELAGSKVLDVGCGGGILAESLAAAGAGVTAIDISEKALATARLHLHESGLEVDYRLSTVEALAQSEAGSFDVVTCMEMLEHVPDPASVLAAVGDLLRPGGQAFFSTLNRTPMAFAVGIVGAEYVARLLPRGTHRYDRFIRPSELSAWARSAGLRTQDISGLHYNPIMQTTMIGGHVQVNYLAWLHKPAEQT